MSEYEWRDTSKPGAVPDRKAKGNGARTLDPSMKCKYAFCEGKGRPEYGGFCCPFEKHLPAPKLTEKDLGKALPLGNPERWR